jgi:hypothetical protein
LRGLPHARGDKTRGRPSPSNSASDRHDSSLVFDRAHGAQSGRTQGQWGIRDIASRRRKGAIAAAATESCVGEKAQLCTPTEAGIDKNHEGRKLGVTPPDFDRVGFQVLVLCLSARLTVGRQPGQGNEAAVVSRPSEEFD